MRIMKIPHLKTRNIHLCLTVAASLLASGTLSADHISLPTAEDFRLSLTPGYVIEAEADNLHGVPPLAVRPDAEAGGKSTWWGQLETTAASAHVNFRAGNCMNPRIMKENPFFSAALKCVIKIDPPAETAWSRTPTREYIEISLTVRPDWVLGCQVVEGGWDCPPLP